MKRSPWYQLNNNCIDSQTLQTLLTSQEEEDEEFTQVSDREIVSITNSWSCDQQEPDAVNKPHVSRCPGIGVIMERISSVLKQVDYSSSPEQEGQNVCQYLIEIPILFSCLNFELHYKFFQIYLSYSDMWRLLNESDEDEDIRNHDQHPEPEASYSDPRPLEPDCSEEWGQGDDVNNGWEREEEMIEWISCHQAEEGVEDEDDSESKINLNGESLIPGDALFNQTRLNINDVESHGPDVADHHEDHQQTTNQISPRDYPFSPFFDLRHKRIFRNDGCTYSGGKF